MQGWAWEATKPLWKSSARGLRLSGRSTQGDFAEDEHDSNGDDDDDDDSDVDEDEEKDSDDDENLLLMAGQLEVETMMIVNW